VNARDDETQNCAAKYRSEQFYRRLAQALLITTVTEGVLMLTKDCIDQVRQQTSVSTVDAMHALSVAGGDVARAIEELNDHSQCGNRKIAARGRTQAQRLAAALVDAGIWFECEAIAAGEWRFSVALGAYARVCALTATLCIDEPLAAVA
jgi:hypothetical protein